MSIISQLTEKVANKMQEMDKEIETLTKLSADVEDFSARNEFESKLLSMRLKREKLHAHEVISRSQSIIAEMKMRIAQSELDVELCELRILIKKLRRNDEELREVKKAKLPKISEDSDAAEYKCSVCKSKSSSKNSKSKDAKSKSPKKEKPKTYSESKSKTSQTHQNKNKHHDKYKHSKKLDNISASKIIIFEETNVTSSQKNNTEKNDEVVTMSEQQNATNTLFNELRNNKDIQTIQIDLESVSNETLKIRCACEDPNCQNYEPI